MSIKQRLTMGFGAVLAVTALAIAITSQQLASMRLAAESITTTLSPQVAAANDLAVAVDTRATSLRAYALSGERRYLDKYKTSLAESQTALADIRRIPMSPEDGELISNIDRNIVRMRQEETEIIRLVGDDQLSTASRHYYAHLQPLADLAIASAHELATIGHDRILAAADEFRRTSNRMDRVTRLSFLAALVLALIFIVATVRSISHPAKTIALAAGAVADGDYDKALALRGHTDPLSDLAEPKDELRRIAVALGDMARVLQRREKRLTAHASLGEKCSSSLDIDCLLDGALTDVAEHTGSQLAVIYLPEDDTWRAHGVYGISKAEAELAAEGQGGMVEQAAKSGKPIVSGDIPADTRFIISPGLGKALPRSIVCMPMRVENRTLGVLVCASLSSYDDDAITLIGDSAAQIGIALSNALSHRNMQMLAESLRAANERLDAQNEVLQAQNEELQAQNEEIQAQSEEIQAQNEELAIQRTELQESYAQQRSIAETLQKAFLPDLRPRIDNFEIAHRYLPAQSEALVGGDFYDVIELAEGILGIVIGDVSGKGIGATMHTAMARFMIRGIALQEPDPSVVLRRLNDAVAQAVHSEVFITLFYGVLDTTTNKLTYANAGHELPLLLRCDTGDCVRLESTGQPMGIFPNAVYESRTIELADGDALILYTDGITEARHEKRFFGYAGLETSVADARSLQADDMANAIMARVKDFTGGGLGDDAALVVIKAPRNG